VRDAAQQLSEGRAKTERLERAQEALIAERNQALDEVRCSDPRSCFKIIVLSVLTSQALNTLLDRTHEQTQRFSKIWLRKKRCLMPHV
jgi:hypothetical protein